MTNRIQKAFKVIDRKHFVLPQYEDLAYVDRPLPIGFGQTISQPMTVRLMLEWLDPRPGHKVLDVGSGSGWTSALLSYVVGDKGRVTAVELVPQLVDFGRENCQKIVIGNVTFYQAKDQLGWPAEAPYDRILVSAAAERLPRALIDQLKVGGIMVVPVGSDILVVKKTSKLGKPKVESHSGFAFVPLIE